MLQLEISGVHFSVDPALNKYVSKKIGGLDKYLPRNIRNNVLAQVHIKESKTKDNNNCCCEVSFHLPQQSIIVKESSLNMYAAVDIAEAKLKIQLKKYKDTHGSSKSRRHLMARFLRKAA